MMITSAVPAEGKTLTAVNLALTLSESYRKRVLLVDADLRKPTLHQLFHLNASAGLSEGLAAPADAKLVVRQVSSRLSVLPGGRPTADPMAALSSRRMRQLIEEAKETFDWVILDTPPLVLLPDAHLLSSMVDGTLLVIRANSTPHAMVARAMDIIGRESITGVVLNQAAQGQPSFGTGAHPYYHPALVPEQRP
jgi:protein-tyrosine kinase